jgi:hypothetical protein
MPRRTRVGRRPVSSPHISPIREELAQDIGDGFEPSLDRRGPQGTAGCARALRAKIHSRRIVHSARRIDHAVRAPRRLTVLASVDNVLWIQGTSQPASSSEIGEIGGLELIGDCIEDGSNMLRSGRAMTLRPDGTSPFSVINATSSVAKRL